MDNKRDEIEDLSMEDVSKNEESYETLDTSLEQEEAKEELIEDVAEKDDSKINDNDLLEYEKKLKKKKVVIAILSIFLVIDILCLVAYLIGIDKILAYVK